MGYEHRQARQGGVSNHLANHASQPATRPASQPASQPDEPLFFRLSDVPEQGLRLIPQGVYRRR